MFKVGLTGGIGSGKSTAAIFFQNQGIEVIDLDQLSRDVVAPNTNALTKIADHFGEDVLDQSGHLNRQKLGELIFNNEGEKRWLEQQIHPLVQRKKEQIIKLSTSRYIVIEIPLLTENKLEKSVDSVLLIDCDKEVQIQRAIKRGKQSAEQIHKIIEQQSSRKERQAIADDIVINDGAVEDLEQQLNDLHLKYLALTTKPIL